MAKLANVSSQTANRPWVDNDIMDEVSEVQAGVNMRVVFQLAVMIAQLLIRMTDLAAGRFRI
ncbi:hypothetical protein [Pantoea allii]|uniref:hypothetical protein n=1 Tax=Pantoea allii TaxID=574096 RepID=UPI001F4F07BF|nr:hypothetical protein [Pantoea allii]MCH9298340.1 hypothetical protein [Pantoea allii]